jgi:Protein of unknown function (DUF3168)
MTFAARFYTALSGNAGVAALVGTRIYPMIRARGDVLPALVYSVISASPIATLNNSGYADDIFSVSCDAVTYAGAQTLADAVALALDNFKYTEATPSAVAPFIYACRLDSRAETIDNSGERAGATYRVTLDFYVNTKG